MTTWCVAHPWLTFVCGVFTFSFAFCPCCEAEKGNALPQDQKHGRRGLPPHLVCALDAALTAAGLPAQESRDLAREEMRRT